MTKKTEMKKMGYAYKGGHVSLRKDEVIGPDGRDSFREFMEHPGAVALVALFEDGRLLFNRQFRYATGETLWEIPAGTREVGETPLACARREFLEETGYKAGRLKQLAKFYVSPGVSNEMIYIYLATNLKKVDDNPIGHLQEGIKNRTFPFEQAVGLALKGKIQDSKTLIGILTAREYLKNEASEAKKKKKPASKKTEKAKKTTAKKVGKKKSKK